VRSERVEELVLCAATVRRVAGEERGGPAHSEEAVHQQHGGVVAPVHARDLIFRAQNQRVRVRVCLQIKNFVS